MNYYEELGIRPDASVEEIRQAYRMLARVLHPDAQPDPALRAMAEIQMRRLNEIVTILVSSQQRRDYDASLTAQARPAGSPPWMPEPAKRGKNDWRDAVRRYGFWALLGCVVLATGIWYMLTRDPLVAARISRDRAASEIPAVRPAPFGPAETLPPRQDPGPRTAVTNPGEFPPRTYARHVPDPDPFHTSPAEDRRMQAPLAVAPEEAPPIHPAAPSPVPAPPAVALQATGKLPQPAAERRIPERTPAAPETSFAGNWLYSPEKVEPAAAGLYPAWYAELVLLESGGEIAGNYRALYRVPDQALSPQVLFRMQGRSTTARSTAVEWSSEDGARGQAELTLRSPNLLNVTWWTTQPGRRATVPAGSALLIRQQVP